MRKKTLFLLIVLLTLVVSVVTSVIIERNRIIQVTNYAMDVRVTNSSVIGINVDPDGFHFGSLRPGLGSRRDLRITQVEEDALVTIVKKGEIANWVSNPNNFIIRTGENKNISFSITIPETAELGNYTGTVTIILKRV